MKDGEEKGEEGRDREGKSEERYRMEREKGEERIEKGKERDGKEWEES